MEAPRSPPVMLGAPTCHSRLIALAGTRPQKSPSPSCANKAFAALLRRNNFTFSRPNVAALGVRAWGDITMTGTESGEERKHQVERYRLLAQEVSDPLAAGLLRNIISELEADLNELAEDALWSPKRRPA